MKIFRLFYIGFISMIMTCNSYTQNCTLKGFVYDAATGNPVRFANVTLGGTIYGTYSDDIGYYLIDNITPGTYNLKVFCLGYDTITEKILLGYGDIKIMNFRLNEISYSLGEINVTSQATPKKQEVNISKIHILPAEIEKTPSIGGLPDIVQHIQTIPGVVVRGDIGGQMYIRGGTPIQNRVLMDDAVVYSPIHSIGLFSVFDHAYIQGADVFTGGFDAEFGGALSSVINVKTKYGNPHRYSGSADLSTVGSRFFIEGPIVKPNENNPTSLSFLFSVKNSHFKQAKQLFYSSVDHDLPFYFNDIYGKLSIHAGQNLKVNLFGFNYLDNAAYSNSTQEFSRKSRGFGGNLLVMPTSASVLMKIYFAASDYTMNLEEPSKDTRYSKVGSFSIGLKLFKYMRKQLIRFGLEVMGMKTDYHYYTSDFNEFWQLENSSEVSAFLQYRARAGKFILEPGLRMQFYATISKLMPEPRILIKYLATDNFRLKLSAGLYSQNLISAVSDRDIINYFEGYISAPVSIVTQAGESQSDLYIQKARQLVFGIEYDLGKNISANVEGYWKNFDQLISFNKKKIFDPSNIDESNYYRADFISEWGYATGCDVSINYRDLTKNLSITYSFGITEREYQDINGNLVSYYPHYDRRHNLNVMGSINVGKSGTWNINARWNYGSGFPYTPSIGYYEGVTFDEYAVSNWLTQNGNMEVLYGAYNSERLPAYHRLDIGVKKTIPLRKTSSLVAEATIINVYNRKNIFYVDRKTNETIYQLPFLPGLRVGYSF